MYEVKYGVETVLGLAGVIFFTGASTGLWFGFVLKRVMIYKALPVTAEQGFHSAKAFVAPQPTPPEGRLGLHKELGKDRTLPGLGSGDSRGPIPCGIMLNI